MVSAYYNENDAKAAAWLRELIKQGHIAAGDVDERSIEDVRPNDLRGYTQCHFFAGIGVWSYALRQAGWADDRAIWTGSCPCQPFSSAGKGAGFADERHLWPAWFHLIEQCAPAIVVGEQVASKDAGTWIDLVQDDLEAMGYAFGAIPFPAASVGAPHIRDRLYWVANADERISGQRGADIRGRTDGSDAQPRARLGGSVVLGRVADADSGQCDGFTIVRGIEHNRADAGRSQSSREPESCGDVRRMADYNGAGFSPRSEGSAALGHGKTIGTDRGASILANANDTRSQGRISGRHSAGEWPTRPSGVEREERPGPTNGHWQNADWLLCRDGKWRPVEPGTFPLVDGATARVGRLRGYGNAIVAQQAQAFIEVIRGVA